MTNTSSEHFPILEDIVNVICTKTNSKDKKFFRIISAYFLAKIAGCMRANVDTAAYKGIIPLNLYVTALATSGTGKGHSISIIQDTLLSGFMNKFIHNTMPNFADINIASIAQNLAISQNNINDAEIYEKLQKEYENLGSYVFTLDSGTTPAIKQLRQKLLFAGSGSINLQIDEIGSNLLSNFEVLTAFLELYDKGIINEKLTKSTSDNKRSTTLFGSTPANMLLFGTPTKIFDSGIVEKSFHDFMETGYARRCLFGLGNNTDDFEQNISPEAYLDSIMNPAAEQLQNKLLSYFITLAEDFNLNKNIPVEKPELIQLVTYELKCREEAYGLNENDSTLKAELLHRHFKVLKLAGVYAFIDKSQKVTENHIKWAINLVEESGNSFKKIIKREKPYIKLVKYLTSIEGDVTLTDLSDNLSFFPSTLQKREELMTLARSHALTKNICMKETQIQNVTLLSAEELQLTDLNKLKISSSIHPADNYQPREITLIELNNLGKINDYNVCSHYFKHQHRCNDNIIEGFNLCFLDIDDTTKIDTVKLFMQDYTYVLYTTKRHTNQNHRFRLILPLQYTLNHDVNTFKLFMNNLIHTLPFKVDISCNEISKKWLTNKAAIQEFNDVNNLFNPLPFIPYTSENNKLITTNKQISDLSQMETWFFREISTKGVGNRNNMILRYAYVLLNNGNTLSNINNTIKEFNKRLPEPLLDSEIDNTVLKTIANKIT